MLQNCEERPTTRCARHGEWNCVATPANLTPPPPGIEGLWFGLAADARVWASAAAFTKRRGSEFFCTLGYTGKNGQVRGARGLLLLIGQW